MGIKRSLQSIGDFFWTLLLFAGYMILWLFTIMVIVAFSMAILKIPINSLPEGFPFVFLFVDIIISSYTTNRAYKKRISKRCEESESKSNSSATSEKSQYSEFPRYYTINGVKYDIDNPKSIEQIPLVSNTFSINGKTYGMDTILYEHYRQCPDRSLGYTAFDKCEELRKHGIIHKSDWELELESRWEARKAKEDARKQQCDSFTVEDMQQFPDIPIAWQYIVELNHTDGIAWCQLNWNNQQIVLRYISQINDIIVDAQSYVDGIGKAHIDLYSMDFNYPMPMYMNSMCNTRIECYPYTTTGKLSKYPVLIQFATKQDANGLRSVGEIKILRDGNIGAATVSINGNTFKIGLHGTSLVLKRVDNPYLGGNLFKFSEIYD